MAACTPRFHGARVPWRTGCNPAGRLRNARVPRLLTEQLLPADLRLAVTMGNGSAHREKG
jgi:hypothetical protein